MVLGLALLSWDESLGPITDFKYPKHLKLTSDLLNEVCMSHALKENKEEELFELGFNNQIILSYCDKSRVEKFGFEILVLIINKREEIKLFELKAKLKSFAQSVMKHTKALRNDYILAEIGTFFRKTTEKKMLILGRAGTGKSTIKEIIFEGRDPKDLIFNPLEPTRGLSPSVYSWLDLNLGFFDSSGQELNNLLDDKHERSLAFENTSIVIYVFDYPSWNYQQQEIIEEINKILKILKDMSSNAKLILFIHKIDLLKNYGKIVDQEILNIKQLVKDNLDLPIYLTSVYPEYIYSVYNAFCEILGMLSPESQYLKNLLDDKIKDFSKTMAFITNKDHSIVAQSIIKDFDLRKINHIHKLTAQFNQSFLDMVENDNINYFLMSSYKGLIIIMKHLDLPEFDISKIICVSQTLSNEKLVDLSLQFGIKIEKIQTEY
jgi:hypothetical protein